MGQRLPAGSESVAMLIRQRRELRDTRTAQTRTITPGRGPLRASAHLVSSRAHRRPLTMIQVVTAHSDYSVVV